MHHSIYTSAFNVIKMGFAWKETLDNWSQFLGRAGGQITVAVNSSEDDSFNQISAYTSELASNYWPNIEYTVFQTNIPYTDPLFDGKIKNEALKRCNRLYCSLLDLDEVFMLPYKQAWQDAISNLESAYGIDAMMIPVIDLFHDEFNYRSLSQKWYLHKNVSHLERGVVNFARKENGLIDVNKSDSCELIYKDSGDLVRSIYALDPRFDEQVKLHYLASGAFPLIVHLGWLHKEQRIKQSEFWTQHWNARAGEEVEKVKTLDELDQIPYKRHNLPKWNLEV